MNAKPASTILLLAPVHALKGLPKDHSKSIAHTCDYRIFMVKRSSHSSFSGAYVFPGGKIEHGIDDSEFFSFHHDGVGSSSAVSRGDGGAHSYLDKDERIHRVGAVREVFEEAGFLLFRSNSSGKSISHAISPEQMLEWRNKVHGDSKNLIDFCKKFDCHPDCASLIPWSHWITPVQEQKRFDTRFYLLNVESYLETADHRHHIHDGRETVQSQWFEPQEALGAFEKKEIYLAPPTWYLLSELARYYPSYQLLNNVKRDLSPIQPNIILPSLSSSSLPHKNELRAIIALPGDHLHHDYKKNHEQKDEMNPVRRIEITKKMEYILREENIHKHLSIHQGVEHHSKL